jgi:hypothetical protein
MYKVFFIENLIKVLTKLKNATTSHAFIYC